VDLPLRAVRGRPLPVLESRSYWRAGFDGFEGTKARSHYLRLRPLLPAAHIMSLSAEDVSAWQALQPPKGKGKPTPEEIEQRKTLKAREVGFLKDLCARLGQDEADVKKMLNKALKAAGDTQKAAEKAAKAAEAAAKKKATVVEEELDPTKYRENRLKAMGAMEAAGIEPLPHKFEGALGPSWMTVREFISRFDNAGTLAGQKLDGVYPRVCPPSIAAMSQMRVHGMVSLAPAPAQ
jgi:hypothetical protein